MPAPTQDKLNQLITLFNARRFAELESRALLLLEKYPASGVIWKLLGVNLLSQGKDALSAMQQAAKYLPDDAEAHYNLANVQKEQGRFEEAVASYKRSLVLKPDFTEALCNLGIVLRDVGRLDEAVASYRQALKVKPAYAKVYSNLGLALHGLEQFEEAEASCRRALAIKPDYAEAHNNLGLALKSLKKFEQAQESFLQAVAFKPQFAEAHYNLGNVLRELGQIEGAVVCLQRALEIKPDFPFAFGEYLYCKMHCCDWAEIDNDFGKILGDIDANKVVSTPFILLAIPSAAAQQKQCAEIWVREKYPEVGVSANVNNRYAHDKIRLGYFSSDLYKHATAYLMAELLEKHDRSKFEVIGFSFGASPDDDMRKRVSAGFDRFIDVHTKFDREICELARSLEIDIAIDLKGFTANARTGIFALRAAPIQVNYLGYPGTMGAPYIDYLIADPTLIPVEHQPHYTEKIAYLPDSYQVNDSHRQISDRQFTRKEVGLPEEGFVFCCSNNNYKITPAVFDIWMQLLKQVEGSVLWLFEGNEWATPRLLNEATQRGVAPERIVFAKRMELPEHLARHRLADLFLDTFYYNAHTTASDALWAGLPVITYLGNTFAGRVAASLLNALGMPELITHTHEEYQALALELATHPEKLALIKQQLAKNRITQPLFDTELFTRHIEEAYTRMWQRQQESLLPEHIYVEK